MSSRRKSKVATLALCVVLFCVAVSATAAAEDARVVEAYPDTYETDDAGEYVAVEFETMNTTGWTLGDGEDETFLPNRTLDGTVYFADGGAPEDRNDYSLGLRLANSGEVIVLRNASDEVVDEMRYGDESDVEPNEGELVVRVGDAPTALETRHVGATDFDVLRTNVSDVTAFAVPDASGVVADEFRDADERLLVGAFTFGSGYLADVLRETEADVSVLVESTPPGGFGVPTERVLDSLAEAADVYVADGEQRRYRFLHAKYAVVDDSAVVTTENWGDRNFAPDATGSRGWGVVLEGEETADYLARVFREDVDWRAVSSWENASVESHEGDESDAEVRTGFDAVETGTAEIELFVTPDEPVEPVVSLIESADDEVLVQQSYVRAWSDGNLSTNPYVSALEKRAEDGVDVRVLLDGRWYYEDENAEVADALEASGIETRLAAYPVHTKGVVVDGESALVSSINWNENSPTENREVGVVVHDEEVAGYFAEVFETDWDTTNEDGEQEDSTPQPSDYVLEIVIIVVVSGIGVWLVTREM
ncbi:MAG: phospholipase D-like domain-containing protein [Halobacteriales archaeon]|nr:phospholipase D-like domain-containing protein [Halobacteriales archaeon]